MTPNTQLPHGSGLSINRDTSLQLKLTEQTQIAHHNYFYMECMRVHLLAVRDLVNHL